MSPTSHEASGPETNNDHSEQQHDDTPQSTGNEPSSAPSSTAVNDSLAQALREVMRGEQTATALEASLTSLESKLDDLLASFGLPSSDGGETASAAGPDGHGNKGAAQTEKKDEEK